MHCMGNGDDLLGQTSFPEMDYKLGAPDGPAKEVPSVGSGVWRRGFASGAFVIWDNNNKNGTYSFPGEPPPPPEHHHKPYYPPSPPRPPPGPPPAVPPTCGVVAANTAVGQRDLGGARKTASAAACCALCREKEGCAAWAWHTEDGNSCHLHSVGAYFHSKEGCYAGNITL